MKMSLRRTALGGLSGAGKSSIQSLRSFVGCSSRSQGQASISTTSAPTALHGSRRSIPKAYRLGSSVSSPSLARRAFSATTATSHGHWEPPPAGKELYVTFVDKDGDEIKIAVNEGDNLLTVAQANDVEMEGACEGSCSCSTCHVIVDNEDMYDKMEEATDDENDMLDLAFGITETSRLGCQIVMKKELDGLVVKLPSMTRNMQASDFEKKK